MYEVYGEMITDLRRTRIKTDDPKLVEAYLDLAEKLGCNLIGSKSIDYVKHIVENGHGDGSECDFLFVSSKKALFGRSKNDLGYSCFGSEIPYEFKELTLSDLASTKVVLEKANFERASDVIRAFEDGVELYIKTEVPLTWHNKVDALLKENKIQVKDFMPVNYSVNGYNITEQIFIDMCKLVAEANKV